MCFLGHLTNPTHSKYVYIALTKKQSLLMTIIAIYRIGDNFPIYWSYAEVLSARDVETRNSEKAKNTEPELENRILGPHNSVNRY